jgi:hypothetical protein
MREFCIERNALDDDESHSRKDIRAAIHEMGHQEVKVLKSRLRRRMRRLTDLMDGERKTFDEPHATTDSLVVPLSNETVE